MTSEDNVSIKISDMTGVTEYGERHPVELWFDGGASRMVVSAYNQCGDDFVNIDLCELLDWLRYGPHGLVENRDGRRFVAVGRHT